MARDGGLELRVDLAQGFAEIAKAWEEARRAAAPEHQQHHGRLEAFDRVAAGQDEGQAILVVHGRQPVVWKWPAHGFRGRGADQLVDERLIQPGGPMLELRWDGRLRLQQVALDLQSQSGRLRVVWIAVQGHQDAVSGRKSELLELFQVCVSSHAGVTRGRRRI